MNNPESANQTQFAFEEPIFSDTNVELPVEKKPAEEVPKKNNKKKMVIIATVVFFILLLLIVAATRSKKRTVVEVPEEEIVEVVRDLGPIEGRIENARLDLDIADPANQDLTFPPVDMGLRLDKKEK